MSSSTSPISTYHAHVYFDGPAQRAEALALRDAVSNLLPDARMGRVHEQPIAFHPTAMFQIAFPSNRFAELVQWLMLHRGSLSILVHPLTGDAWAEHTAQAIWLGPQKALNLDILRRIAAA